MMPRTARRYHAALAAALTGACTTQVTRTPCVVNADCTFPDTPGCIAGVCTATGTGPAGCFTGDPHTALDLANQCTTARFFSFDNCDRLNVCTPEADAAVFTIALLPPPTQPPVTPVEPQPTVNCADASPTVIYLTGSADVTPMIRAVQSVLSRAVPGFTVVFLPQTSCLGAAAIYDPTHRVIMNAVNHWPFYFDANGLETLCLLDPAGNAVDIGESDVDPAACGYAPVGGIADYGGPIRTASFVVPTMSLERAISAEAAHLVFAAGGEPPPGALIKPAAPWTDSLGFVVGGAEVIGLAKPATAVPLPRWWGTLRLPSDAVAAIATTDPSLAPHAIGLLSGDALAHGGRDQVRQLAFQGRGQIAGFLPDSSPDALDKANVRDGHYAIWSPTHFLTATPRGTPSQAVSTFLAMLTNPRLDQALMSDLIDAGFLPACAMQVRQSPEGPVPFAPPYRCGCFFDGRVTGHTACHACAGPGDCPNSAPACNYGYCEAQ